MPADPQDSYRSAFGGPLHRHLRRSVAPPCVPSLPLGRGIRDLSRSRNRAGPVRPVVKHASTPKPLISRSTSQSYEPSNCHTFQSLSLGIELDRYSRSTRRRSNEARVAPASTPHNLTTQSQKGRCLTSPRGKNSSPPLVSFTHRCKAGFFTRESSVSVFFGGKTYPVQLGS